MADLRLSLGVLCTLGLRGLLDEITPALEGRGLYFAPSYGATNVLLPKKRSYYRYAGSLTTPPCSEGIQWYVLKKPIELDSEQIRFFTSIPGFDQTHRPLQPLGNRRVEAQPEKP